MLHNELQIKNMRIVVIDDEPANVALLQRILKWADFHQVVGFTDSSKALKAIELDPPDVILLDLHMPKIDGYQVMDQLRARILGKEHIPILVFTADVSPSARIEALRLGASDFLTKPGDPSEIILRVRNVLEIRHLHRELRRSNRDLESLVAERTKELDLARLDALKRLAVTAEFRDDDTGEHARRVGLVSAHIAETIGSPEASPHVIELAAPLHDIGKVAIPDSILLKAGKLTPEEFEVMKTHTTIGAQILGGSNVDVFSVASSIALNHHEKWDGSGYPNGLQRLDIPICGRIVAVADVFDALTHKRSYKEAWPVQKAIDYIGERSGIEFDPNVVNAFLSLEVSSGLLRAA